MANVVIPEIQLSEISHVTSVCEDCVNFVTEMHTFRRKCVDNNFSLIKYVKLLSSVGGEIGDSQIRVLDFEKVKVVQYQKYIVSNFQDVNREDNKSEVGIKIERIENEDREYDASSDVAHLQCNETAISDNEAMECKIEVNDDFNDKYDCKEEMNDDDPLEDLHEDTIHSPEQQVSVDNTPSVHAEKGRIYKCATCFKSFSNLRTLKNHNLIHTNEKRIPARKKLKCETCGKCFTFSNSFKRHAKMHAEKKPHKCEICGKCFNFSKSLTKHLMFHTGKDPYECKVCGKGFNTQYKLNRHSVVHTGEKPYSCDVCKNSFRILSDLKRHFMVHTGEKPHKCDICDKTFRLASNLKTHSLLHFDTKLYKCDVCEKSFAVKQYLTRHKIVHSEMKPFKCDVCEKTFFRADYLSKHKLKHHP